MSAPARIRCRPIQPSDLEGIAALLARGFPARPPAYWRGGLARLAARTPPEGYPRFGFLLEQDGQPVGCLLLIAQEVNHEGGPHVRCNVASWYVEPAFRSHAALLGMVPFRFKGATLLNVSAAPSTWATIEAQGFRRYATGQRLTLPLLAWTGGRGLRVTPFDAGRDALPEAGLLADHAALGCLCLIGHGAGAPVPFVFLPARLGQGRWPFPGAHLIFCRAPDDLRRFAAPLGRALARRGLPVMIVDEVPGRAVLPGLPLPGRGRRYVRGPRTPAWGDLAYTEFTIFGA